MPNFTKEQVAAIETGYNALAAGAATRGPDRQVSDWVKALRKPTRYDRVTARAVIVKSFLFGWADPRISVACGVRSDLWPVIMLGGLARETDRRYRSRLKDAIRLDRALPFGQQFSPSAMKAMRLCAEALATAEKQAHEARAANEEG